MKFSSKTLWKAMFLSSLSLPVFADIRDPGIEYCNSNGGCGFYSIAESILDTCFKEPTKAGCKAFNDQLALNYQKKTDVSANYVEKAKVKEEVAKCIGEDSNSDYCQGIKGEITKKYTLTTSCSTNNSTSSQCTAQELNNKVSLCIDPNSTEFGKNECADLRNQVIDTKYLSKIPSHSYLVLSEQKGSDALYLGSANPTNRTNPNSAPTQIILQSDLDTLRNSFSQEDKNNRLTFKWIFGLKGDYAPASKCGVVIGLKNFNLEAMNAKESEIICNLDKTQ